MGALNIAVSVSSSGFGVRFFRVGKRLQKLRDLYVAVRVYVTYVRTWFGARWICVWIVAEGFIGGRLAGRRGFERTECITSWRCMKWTGYHPSSYMTAVWRWDSDIVTYESLHSSITRKERPFRHGFLTHVLDNTSLKEVVSSHGKKYGKLSLRVGFQRRSFELNLVRGFLGGKNCERKYLVILYAVGRIEFFPITFCTDFIVYIKTASSSRESERSIRDWKCALAYSCFESFIPRANSCVCQIIGMQKWNTDPSNFRARFPFPVFNATSSWLSVYTYHSANTAPERPQCLCFRIWVDNATIFNLQELKSH